MAQQYNNPLGVIVGDIVNSTQLEPKDFEQVMETISSIQKFINAEFSDNSHALHRGDEFQSVIFNYEQTLLYVIMYRLAIKALGKQFDCRVSFAVARGAELRESVGQSMGEAFTISGRALGGMRGERLVYRSDSAYHEERMLLLIRYLDSQIVGLTPRQCEIILPLIKRFGRLSYSQLAEDLHISNATVSKALKAAGWSLMKGVIVEFKKTITEIYKV
ncbi:hypothetical protein C9J01_19480 [Photobacterium rosenbergii]|uniref:Uncharacterized protein n=1 Tax=Photobacterium rosenbergii TaxID=294936 RepID=A0A2T3N9F2_9GAMM|nr:hypothetical protein [Photobacterium rosenbergii]PSW10041.1 hypothetical protein C9J01_19480 [Photobacterium rosenbergii]